MEVDDASCSHAAAAATFHELCERHAHREQEEHAVMDVLDQYHVAHVRYSDGDDHLRLQLRIHNDRKTFFRPVSESWSKLRHRLQLLAANASGAPSTNAMGHLKSKKARGKSKKRASGRSDGPCATDTTTTADSLEQLALAPAPAKVSVRFFDAAGGEFQSKSLTIGDVLTQTARIEIGRASYVVLHNQPLVIKLSVLEPVLAGIPVVPIPETEFCNPDECTWQWTRVDATGSETLCSTARRYTPSSADIDCRFRIECHAPARHEACAVDDSKAEATTAPVAKGPSRDVFAARRQLGRTRACDRGDPSAFRVMSYNILYDGYTTTDRAQQTLFPYVQPEALREMYRMQLVFQEIEESSADIVCLQEMGEAACRSFFVPVLEPLGFRGFYAGKTGSTHEGCAVFVRTDVFAVERDSVVDLAFAVKHSLDPTVRALLQMYPDLARGFDKIPSVAQVLLLCSTREPTRRLVVANTHLFYREDAHMIRLLQVLAVAHAVQTMQRDASGDSVGVVLCGDLNAFPDSAAVQFLLRGQIDSSHPHWQDVPQFRWVRKDNGDGSSDTSATSLQVSGHKRTSVAPGRFAHDLALASACGTPAFTNFAGSFVGTLDYVLASRASLHVAQVFPLFSAADVSAEVALPSSTFPSDHISLVCDLAWTAAT